MAFKGHKLKDSHWYTVCAQCFCEGDFATKGGYCPYTRLRGEKGLRCSFCGKKSVFEFFPSLPDLVKRREKHG